MHAAFGAKLARSLMAMPLSDDTPDPSVPVNETAAVLHRAISLDRSAAAPCRVSATELVVMAQELGVAPDAVAKALAEWRLDGADGVTHESAGPGSRLAAALVGPDRITVVRTCRVPAKQALEVVAKSLTRQHLLQISTHEADRVVARRRHDPVAAAGRLMRAMNSGAGLNKVPEVRAAVGKLPDGTAALCLRADVSDGRSSAIAAGCSVGTLSAGIVGFLAVATSVWWLLASPLVAVTGLSMARWAFRGTMRRVRHCLEDLAELGSRGRGPASMFQHLGRAVGRRRTP